jgi:hypothetical protein
MKKLFLFFICICLSLPTLAAEKEGVITRMGKWIDGTTEKCPACPSFENGIVCPDTPYEEIHRLPFELELRLDVFEAPAGGRPQFHAENFSAVLWHNLSPVFQLYGSYSSRSIDKIAYEGSVYDKQWNYQTFVGGVGFYVRPTLKIFAGIGKVIPKNANGSEELSFALERGIAWDIPLNKMGYKLGVSFRSVEAGLASDDAHIAASQADASTNIIAVALLIPIGW